MATTTLSVRIDDQTRAVLAEAAPAHSVAGASALAREILQRWAEDRLAARAAESLRNAVAFVEAHPGGWPDDPADFFRKA